jgi:hypothetical protein
MELVRLFREVARHRVLIVLAILVAAVAAVATAYKLPSMEKRQIAVGAATGQILVDSDPSTLVAGAGTDQIAALGSRARVYAQYLSSRDAVARISSDTGIPAALITARGPFSQGTGISNYDQQPAESRAKDLVDEGKTYRLVFEAQEDVPIITVYATGPTAEDALKLSSASFTTLQRFVAHLKRNAATTDGGTVKTTPQQIPGVPAGTAVGTADDVVVRELGAPEGGTVGGGADIMMMLMAFIATLGVEVLLIGGFFRLQQQRRFALEVDELTAGALGQREDHEHGQASGANADGAEHPHGPRPEYARP